jgi:shikimate kinase
MERCGVDISTTAALFDAAAYGGVELNDNAREKVLADYTAAYQALIELKKKQRKIFRTKS